MAMQDGAPYRPQDSHAVAEMLRGLNANKGKGKGKGGFSCKKNTFDVDSTDIKVDSWKMQDWDYKKPNLPTYARGLFTTVGKRGPEIAIRGYDKFFNHGEVGETEWANIETNTRGPYELSVKENGCIIFFSGLEDGTLLVCSKHSTGARADVETSHAKAGERWIERHLASVGKNKLDLATKLRAMNATAVAELCDDDFEEHVLAYTPESAGLYLHGINLNLPEFATYPHHLVDKFAEDWGFRKTTYVVKDDIRKVKDFLDNIAETGNYDGRDTEGFVIRCQSRANTGEWHDWFFKYKFEEPYLMYRQWRECTKAIIAGRQPKYKKHKKITEEYLMFARRRLHANPALGKSYNNNHGIIKMRDDFLASVGLKGSDIILQEEQNGDLSNERVTGDVMLVPVATIGCGKTTVALALCKLFDWGHVQNDNITVKKGKPFAFATACSHALSQHQVTIADRNNHQRRERQQLIQDISKIVPSARFVALHFVHGRDKYDDIREKLRDRVLARGDNHQTIHTSKGPEEIIGIMEGFMSRFEPVSSEQAPDDAFDVIVDLDPLSSSRENLETVITTMYREYPSLFGDRDMPSPNEMDAAIEAAMHDYEVDIKHEIKSRDDNGKRKSHANGARVASSGPVKQKERKVEYFAVQVPAAQVANVLHAAFKEASADTAKMFSTLAQMRRLQNEFHVTLNHRAASGEHAAAHWAHLMDLHSTACAPNAERDYTIPDPKLGACKVRLERLVWNERVMAFAVRLSPSATGGQEFTSINQIPHITVGTASPDIKPKESNDLLAEWMQKGSGQTGIRELAIKGDAELDGTVKGVLSR